MSDSDFQSPSRRLQRSIVSLHPLTLILSVGVVISFIAALWINGLDLVAQFQSPVAEPDQKAQMIARAFASLVYNLANSFILLGIAAATEYLIRIWRELKAIRKEAAQSAAKQ